MVKVWSMGRKQPYNEEQKDEESPIINNTTDISTNRIRDIEAGVDLADIEVIPSSTRAQEIYSNLIKSASAYVRRSLSYCKLSLSNINLLWNIFVIYSAFFPTTLYLSNIIGKICQQIPVLR